MSTNSQFAGKTAIVTGSGTGIGRATAEHLATLGASVVLAGPVQQELQEVQDAITSAGGTAAAIRTDVREPGEVKAAVEFAVTTFGGLHLAVNNAGISGSNSDITEVPDEEFLDVIKVNLGGVFYGMKYEIPAMLASGGGAIVNISSVYADRGLFRHAPYTASKNGVRGLTRSVAVDYADKGIRINELQPGVIRTPMTASDPVAAEAIAATIPARRMGEPIDLAKAAAFLLSDESDYINGTHIAIDGAFLA